MTDLVECPDVVVAVQDEDADLTGVAARTARKQRREERERARLQRLSQRVVVRRVVDARQGQRKDDEEGRLQRVAQKAAARRAAKATNANGEAAGVEEGGAKDGAQEEPATAEGQQAKESAREGVGGCSGKAAPQQKTLGRRRERDAARGLDGGVEGRCEDRRQKHREKRQGWHNDLAGGEADPRQPSRRGQQGQRDQEGPAMPPAAASEERPVGRHADGGDPPRPPPDTAVGEEDDPGGGASSGSDSSDDSSSSSSSPSSPSAHAMAIAKALATGAPIPTSAPSKTPCFAWERSLQPASAGGVPTPQSAIFTGTPVVVPLASSTELEQFLQAGGVDGEAAVRLRALPPQLQRMVMDRGPVAGTRNPSSVVISRVKEVEALRLGALPGAALLGLGMPGGSAGAAGGGNPLAPNPEIEALISKHCLDPQAASMLRRLSPEQQRLALKLPIQEARNPSAFVMTQLSMPRLLGTGEASRLPTQPHDPTAMMISGLLRI